MISSITIRNFAIIEHSRVVFSGGYSAITGETGAGKSILLKALALALGARANTDVVRRGAREAMIEAEFSLSEAQLALLRPRLDELGLADGERLSIRRIISSNGRNRLFVNDCATRLSVLTDLTAGLVDLIGQHASHVLLEKSRHVGMLDTFTGTTEEALAVASQVTRLRALQREATRLRETAATRRARAKLLDRQLSDIDAAHLSPGEDERLTRDLEKLQNAEQLQETTRTAFYALRESNESVLDMLSHVINEVQRVSYMDPDLEKMIEVLVSSQIEVQEVARDLGRYTDNVYVSPQDLEEMEERRMLIDQLKILHGGEERSIENVLRAVDVLREELDGLAWDDQRVIEATAETVALEEVVMAAARALSVQRQEASVRLAALVEAELAQLGMPNSRFKVSLLWQGTDGEVSDVAAATSASLTTEGLDEVEFLLSANPGEGLKALARTASGGELSRTMLALKGALITTDPVGSYIFDEVDTGIGGGVAETVGRKLQHVGESRQVICITHLPQVASFCHQHLLVTKRVVGTDRTVSEVRSLSRQQRIEEIARMLGGAEITAKTLEHAEEMISLGRSDSAPELPPQPGSLPLVWNNPTAIG
ncbi:MAG: DNA repair protein RecN (Recombination protein N) [Myxococcota bacterium]|jgi:DNA repair protein RecN (Recombination protein N)